MIQFGKPHPGAVPRVWLEISQDRLRENVLAIQRHVAPLKVMAVLKADGYGLGAEQLAPVLKDCGVACFGVAEVDKGAAIRELGCPVHILGGLIDEDIPVVVSADLIAPITDLLTAQKLSREAERQGRIVQCQCNIDTGMGRLGIQHAEALEVIKAVRTLPGLNLIGLYSHFPFAYGDLEFSNHQVDLFLDLLKQLGELGFSPEEVHMANSDGLHNVPRTLKAPFTMVRTGINLYGAYDPEGQRAFEVEQVFELKTRLVAVRELPAGATIGYGRTYCLDAPRRIGTICIGYADGVPFGLASRGEVLVRGKRCGVVGRISMDFTTIDLTEVPDAAVGDEVVCLSDEIPVADWAELGGTISYDIICSFGPRVVRCYV